MGRRRMSIAAFVLAGLLVAVLLVVFVAPHASSSPDGLEKVAAEQGIDRGGPPERRGRRPARRLRRVGRRQRRGSATVVAGLVGVAVTFVVVVGAMWVLRRRRSRRPTEPAAG